MIRPPSRWCTPRCAISEWRIADVQKLLDPEVFVIGGGVTSVGPYFFTHVQQYANEFAKGFSDVTILPAQFGVDAGVIGAAIAARQSRRSGKTYRSYSRAPHGQSSQA